MGFSRDRRVFLPGLDIMIILPALILVFIGILFIYSSGITSTGKNVSNEYIKQIIWAGTGLALMFITAFFNYEKLKRIAFPAYLLTIFILLLTLFVGSVVNGAKSWLGIGPFGIQPSEFSKVITIVFLAFYFNETKKDVKTIKVFLLSFLIAAVPMLLILIQPDLGTAMVFLPIYLVMAYYAGVRKRYLMLIVLPIVLGGLLIFLYAWNSYISENLISLIRIFNDIRLIRIILLSISALIILSIIGYSFFKQKYYYWIGFGFLIILFGYLMALAGTIVLEKYQLMRLIIFYDPYVDELGAGWNIIQSITAIGSGGPLGKGFLAGTQSHYRYLPQQSTDFIFSIIAEEIGFIGCAVIFFQYLMILIRALRISFKAKENFGSLIIYGIIGMIFFHFFENIGMAMGIMPITGIPLLFLSYGGSSLWTALVSMGLILSVNIRNR